MPFFEFKGGEIRMNIHISCFYLHEEDTQKLIKLITYRG